ncbi:ankyrin repeat domain-containing protein 42 [Aspergillus brasiliensis]|uniref:Ankyrin repeat domain-containing protein 42 n=1 Tax=Aspergillus brasiliensis TaxID=319629 RepID=A0A9W5YQL6_9EURO|nr:ankyrin repeat domain-containing protein 42 [Aspergillus brasiliensis]GKZ42906.1 ankyrin repeat domain-containing protein 42 [Aspergillus brasiliensis]
MKKLTVFGSDNGVLKTDAEDEDNRLALAMACLLEEEEFVRDILALRRKARMMDGRTGIAEQLSAALDYKHAFSRCLPTQETHTRVSRMIGGRTPLSCAVEGGNTEIVRMLLENGEDVNEKDADASACTPLHWAAFNEPLANLELLLQQEVNIEAVNTDGHTPLALAARAYKPAAVDLLLEKHQPNINPRDTYGYTPLLLLANTMPEDPQDVEARQKIMRRLIEAGADMELRQGPKHRPALLVAAASGRCEDVAMLLEYGADVNARGAEGLTALDCAAIEGSVEMVQLLLDHNAKIDTQGFHKLTSLDQAIVVYDISKHSGSTAGTIFRPQIIELLLQRKPDLLLQRSESDLFDKEVTITGMAVRLGTPEMVQVLLRYPGSDVEQGPFRMSLLCWAAFNGRTDMVAMLIQQGVTLQGVDGRYGQNALSWAVFRGHQDVFTQLLQTPGFGWDDVDQLGRSALFHAAVADNGEMFEELRSRGSAVHRPDRFGLTPLFVAVQHGRENLVRKILEHHPLMQEPRDSFGRSLSWWMQSTGNDALRRTVQGYGMQLGEQAVIEESRFRSNLVIYVPLVWTEIIEGFSVVRGAESIGSAISSVSLGRAAAICW